MDELFLLPTAPIAMPRAYWMNETHAQLSAQVLLAEPSTTMFERLLNAVASSDGKSSEMDILSDMFHDSALVIPHRKYNMLTSELRRADDEHAIYLQREDEAWDVDAVMAETTYIHFSDWPVPKPWMMPKDDWFTKNYAPACKKRERQSPDCHQRDIWRSLYTDFIMKRQEICGRGSING